MKSKYLMMGQTIIIFILGGALFFTHRQVNDPSGTSRVTTLEKETSPYQSRLQTIPDEEVELLYKEGMNISLVDGPEAARAFFQEHFDKTGALTFLYGVAWFDAVMNHQVEAKKLGDYVLDHHPQPVLQARAHYLLGYVNGDLKDYDVAVYHFQEALKIYQSLAITPSVIKSHLGLASMLIFQKRYQDAKGEINQAVNLSKTGPTDTTAFAYHLLGRVALGEGNLQAGMTFAERELEEYRRTGSSYHEAVALINLGFFLGIAGRIDDCEASTNQGESMLKAQAGAPQRDLFVAINRYLISRCRSEDTSHREALVRSLMVANPEKHYLGALFDFIKDHDCR